MVADLHAHYPMHLQPRGARSLPHLVDGVRAWLVHAVGHLANYPERGKPAVTVPRMREGDVGVVLSVLYSPFDEMDLTKYRRGAPPARRYFRGLIRQLEAVERDIAGNHQRDAAVARNYAEVEALRAEGRLALVHAVEGGFHLGATPEAMDEHIAELAHRGVAYVTLAHLFWRGIATNAPAIPFLPDSLYRLIFRQPDEGLSHLGEAAVRAMVRERVLVDITHMSEHSLYDTFNLLDEIDPSHTVPVLASHMACRFGRRAYNLDDETIARAAERGSVFGVIFCEHFLTEGRHGKPQSFEDSVELMVAHIDHLHEVTGSHDHAAIGSDLDGFIKPTAKGLEDMRAMAPLARALESHYGPQVAGRICSGNALRLLRTAWR